MPKFPELDASLGETLDLPVPLPKRGSRPAGQVKMYSVPPLDADTWTRFTARFTSLKDKALAAKDDDEEVADDQSEAALHRQSLGAVYDELVADGAAWPQIRRCGLTALNWHIHGEERAMEVWAGGIPKRRSTSETDGTTETLAEAPSTPSPGSESGTTRSRRDRASRGQTSSPAGA
ncbi:hypothetical protein OG884_26495 [Streptosporangium sp. NBC_01755]|uniref:DUF7426 family protein n=1 Tax=Streptosporangium sp. NBC_01755 TaxID=2975949 RepID=UPI002DDA16E0|nr:hypothetical protein [Streptosporangium sp. NBC_01755]WSC98399.1 hypothetical protein OG884_26495 [Streptosporangium sp. NBC_01755]